MSSASADPTLAEIAARAASSKPLSLYEASSYVREHAQHPVRLFAVAEMIRARKLHKEHPKLAWLQPPVLYRACFLALPTYAPPVLALARGLLRNDFFETERMLLGLFDRPLYDPETGRTSPDPLVSLEAFGMLAPQYPLSIKTHQDEKFHRLHLESVTRSRAMADRALAILEEGFAAEPVAPWTARLGEKHLLAAVEACKVLARCYGVAAPVTDLRISFNAYARGVRLLRRMQDLAQLAPLLGRQRAELVDSMALIRYYYPHRSCARTGRVAGPAERRAWQDAIREAFPARPTPPVPLPPRGGKIRVGYISPDFRSTAVGWFVTALLGHFDPARFEVYVYNNHTGDLHNDLARLEFRQKPVHWFESGKLHENTLIDVFQTHRPDVLIDLLCFHRPGVLARKPAPRVLTYLGYPGKAYIEGLDGRIVDAVSDPPELEGDAAGEGEIREVAGEGERAGQGEPAGEPLIRLPGCFLCFTPLACYSPNPIAFEPDARSPPRLRIGIFNKSAKFTETTLAAWRAILDARADAELWFKRDERYMDPAVWEAFRDTFGPHRGRVLGFAFCDRVQEYFAYHNRIDLALDTWPYSGTTTTCSALYMGVPLLTVSGREHVERVSESVLVHAGRPEWVVGRGAPLPPLETAEPDRMPHWAEYVRAAAAWPIPADAEREQARREALRAQFMAAMDPAAFMRDWEAMLERVVGRVAVAEE